MLLFYPYLLVAFTVAISPILYYKSSYHYTHVNSLYNLKIDGPIKTVIVFVALFCYISLVSKRSRSKAGCLSMTPQFYTCIFRKA